MLLLFVMGKQIMKMGIKCFFFNLVAISSMGRVFLLARDMEVKSLCMACFREMKQLYV